MFLLIIFPLTRCFRNVPLPAVGIVAEWERFDPSGEVKLDWNAFFMARRRIEISPGGPWELFQGSFLDRPEENNAPSKQGVLVAFVGERPADEGLLERMMGAMKFAPGETAVIFSDRPEKCFQEIISVSPRVVVALGASSLSLLLGRRERLSMAHGKIFDGKVKSRGNDSTFKLIPVFHPDILAINPAMKRVAWSDLQKVFSLGGKSPPFSLRDSIFVV